MSRLFQPWCAGVWLSLDSSWWRGELDHRSITNTLIVPTPSCNDSNALPSHQLSDQLLTDNVIGFRTNDNNY